MTSTNTLASQTIPFSVEHSVTIAASPAMIWDVLTNPTTMQQWMGEPEMKVEIETNWIVNGSFSIRGFHHAHFVNSGVVLEFDPPRRLRYTQLSSLSRLPDKPENHSIIDFRLEARGESTALTLTLSQFPTETIYRHLDFYWRVTMGILKDFIEKSGDAGTLGQSST